MALIMNGPPGMYLEQPHTRVVWFHPPTDNHNERHEHEHRAGGGTDNQHGALSRHAQDEDQHRDEVHQGAGLGKDGQGSVHLQALA